MSLFNKIEYQVRDYNIHLNTTFYKYKKRKVNAFWCRANNFGDWLTPIILKNYGYTVLFSSAYNADIILVGSILEQVPHLYKGKILGTGLIYSDSKLSFPNAEILGLRGKLTQKHIGIATEMVLGDPGLIISELIKGLKIKKYKLGIIPHANDTVSKIISTFKNRKHVKVIYPQQHPLKVAKEVSFCDAILSSSLHGLVYADSFAIPNRRIILSNNLVGGNFKFDDYYSVLECDEKPMTNLTGNENLDKLIESTSIKSPTILNEIKSKFLSKLENISL